MPVLRPPPDLQGTHALHSRGPVTLLVRRDWADALPLEPMLGGAPLTAWGEPLAHDLKGRGEVHVLGTSAGEIVAKAYSRGGVIGALLRHWYGDPWRPAREAEVAEGLLALDCPTAPVVAARATRGGAGMYRLEIATARVTGARDLLDALRQARGSPGDQLALAAGAGRTLRRLHDVGLHHRDLQVKNLLVPDGFGAPDALLVVIDLDRCRLDAAGDASPADTPSSGLPPTERVASLARFARSLVKNGVLPGRGDAPGDRDLWRATRAFASAYGPLAGAGRASLLRDVAHRLRRSLRTHELLWNAPAEEGPV